MFVKLKLNIISLLVIFLFFSNLTHAEEEEIYLKAISDQIQEALSNIQNADNAQSQMKGILQMRSLSEKYPENADLQWNMGLFSIRSGQYEKAVARFEKVINIDAQRFDAYMQLAMSYLALQDTSSATGVLISLIDKSEGDTQKNAEAMLEKLK